ncbi:SH2 domain protein A, putative isoform 2 [Hibiscus syriacus]|uniref:Probable purine permease n=1 Tax=Hibiscus syriacus TaxID=106335 RepID=A0A6A3CCS4_HIBSY|nr:SH2 domain protein A, putative isoform 2 [Hibiscus syriacus]
MLLPFTCLHNEAPGSGNTDLPSTVEIEQNGNKWINVGYVVSSDFVRLYINGEVAGELHLSSLLNKDSIPNGSRKRALIDIRGDRNFHAFIHDAKVLPSTFSIKDQYVKDSPLRLSIDKSTTSNIEEDHVDFWHIFGGKIYVCKFDYALNMGTYVKVKSKSSLEYSLLISQNTRQASRRRIFSLDVVLLDIFGQPVNKELEVVASLLYAFNRLPVKKINGEKPPLLVSCDGIEFASSDRPSKLSKGRASFKLKISKVDDHCHNRTASLAEAETPHQEEAIAAATDQHPSEMEKFNEGKAIYVAILIGTALAWQICTVGVVGLVYLVSSLFSNVVSMLSLPFVPVVGVVLYGEKNGCN